MSLVAGISFPARERTHRGTWRALYLEPLPGSGEHVCIGVIVEDANHVAEGPKLDLGRLEGAVGPAVAGALRWAAQLAIAEALHVARTGGLQALAEWRPTIERLTCGAIRMGAGLDIGDLARSAIGQCSMLVSHSPSALLEEEGEQSLPDREKRLVSRVRRLVSDRRPEFYRCFDRKIPWRQDARPYRYAFVGKHLIANIGVLSGRRPGGLTQQLDRAKARISDLSQLRGGTLADLFPADNGAERLSLLIHQEVSPADLQKAGLRRDAEKLRGAQEVLDAEADRYSINVVPLRTPLEMAERLLSQETGNF